MDSSPLSREVAQIAGDDVPSLRGKRAIEHAPWQQAVDPMDGVVVHEPLP